jgi:transposase
MEAVLDLYARRYDPREPVVGFDETSKQLVQETRTPTPASSGQAARHDYEYRRNGVANLFVCFEPLGAWRHVAVTEQRTKSDFAKQMKELVDVHFPTARRVHVVLDNLNTHTKGALYEAFPAPEAKRIADRLTFHYTPKHASWLNVAELELAILTKQCLKRRIGDRETLKREIAAWEKKRNDEEATIWWRFNITHARTKLKHLYPS